MAIAQQSHIVEKKVKKVMKKSGTVLLVLAFGLGMVGTAMSASVGGTVASPQGQSVAGVQVIAKDASGHVVGQASAGTSGSYNISGLQPGNYNFTLDPASSGFQGQTVASYVGADGICLNWGVSTTSPAVATAQPGSTCQPIAGGWGDTAALAGAGATVLAGGAIAAAVVIPGSDHQRKTSKSTGQ